MNEKQVVRIEGALMSALSFMQQHPPQKLAHDEECEYDALIGELRVAVALCRTWMALARSTPGEVGVGELPGQQHIPGVEPCNPSKSTQK